MQKDSPYTITSSETAWSCDWFSVQKDQLQLPDGSEATYHYAVKNPCVFIVPITPEGNIVLIRSYRHPLKQWCIEVPAGGKKEHQTLLQAAKAELLEEVGGTSNEWEEVGSFYLSNGSSNEQGTTFLAIDVELHEPNREPLEQIELMIVSIDRALEMARNGDIVDASSALSLLRCEEIIIQYYGRHGHQIRGQ